jgi:hypothetical protein
METNSRLDKIAAFLIAAAFVFVFYFLIKGFDRDLKLSRANQNAKLVYSAAQFALEQYVKQNGTYNTKNISTLICRGSESENVHLGNSVTLNLKEYLGEDFSGYFSFTTDNAGDDIEYALWSSSPFVDITQKSGKEQDEWVKEYSSSPKNPIIGCYPVSS